MKKIYIIAAVALLVFTGCKKQETQEMDIDSVNDSVVQQDTTSMEKDGVVVSDTTTAIDSSDVELLNKMSVKTTTTNIDETKGKYSLSETKWKLVELNGKAVTNNSGKDYFINLDSKSGKFAAYAGCNKIFGSFVMKAATKLAFSNVGSTKMACADASVENDFNKALAKVDNYMIEGKMLHFHNGKKAVAKFDATK